MKDKSYIVASLGRCGSQLMTETIHNHIWGNLDHPRPFLKKTRPFIREYPPEFKNGTVYKTHLYPTGFPENCKVVFTFGDPLDIVLSIIRKAHVQPDWGPAHFANFKANWADFEKIMSEDILRFENMFDAFCKEQPFELMTVRYEALWDIEKEMSDFLEFDLKMPTREERTASQIRELVPPHEMENFKNGYGSLIEKINKAEDIKTWSKK